MLSKHILTAKSIIINNLKIQMLAENSLKICVSAGFEISSTLVHTESPRTMLPWKKLAGEYVYTNFFLSSNQNHTGAKIALSETSLMRGLSVIKKLLFF